MEYERIRDKPGAAQGGGGLSPRKLRSMLMGGERKKIGEEEEIDLASLAHEGGGGDGLDNCRDVDVVTVENERRVVNNHPGASFKARSNEEGSLECENGSDRMNVVAFSVFEFHKSERAAQRAAAAVAPFSKPAPSKWDDAQKWIASPTATRPKVGQVQGGGLGGVLRKVSNFGNGNKQLNGKVAMDVSDQKMVAYEEPDTKRIDLSHKKEAGEEKYVNWETNPAVDSYCKPLQMMEHSVGQSAINLSCHDSSMSLHGSTTFIPPPSTARSVSMRDMGTEMTPAASQEPSRNGTPVRSTTPTRRPSSPGRTVSGPSPGAQFSDFSNSNNEELSEKELQMKTRREIIALGKQLGKTNIAAWASKAEEDIDASTTFKIKAEEQAAKSVIDAKATAWEEAEKSKYMARFKRDEIRIQAWENHQKAKAEAEMKKTDVEVERMKALAHDRLTSKLAATRHEAEEKLAKAEAKRNRQAAKAEQQANYIRRTGRTPSSFSCCSWCSW